MLGLTLLTFGMAWWLGLYLVARDPHKALLRRVGLGLISYALALALDLLRGGAAGALAVTLARLHNILIFLPALAWAGATILLLPEHWPPRERLDTAWRRGLAPLTIVFLISAALLGWFDSGLPAGALFWGLCALVLVPLGAALALVVLLRRQMRPGAVAGLLAAATLLFGLGAGLLVLPLSLPHDITILSIGADLIILGLIVAVFDAFDEGETLRFDLLRSLIGSAGAALLFGGQVAIALLLGAGAAFSLTALLLGCVAAAIAAQVLAAPLNGLIDQLAFLQAPQLHRARAELQAESEALPRVNQAFVLEGLDEAEFARLTRRALSHYGDLARLASSPLTRLPLIDRRLAARGAPDQPLERAAELKALLAERIARLKPRAGEFGTSDEWRHYNALHFPYVVGLRPYSRRVEYTQLDPVAQRALDWLASQVPERTLHNWQNAAARLIAADLSQEAGLGLQPEAHSASRPPMPSEPAA